MKRLKWVLEQSFMILISILMTTSNWSWSSAWKSEIMISILMSLHLNPPWFCFPFCFTRNDHSSEVFICTFDQKMRGVCSRHINESRCILKSDSWIPHSSQLFISTIDITISYHKMRRLCSRHMNVSRSKSKSNSWIAMHYNTHTSPPAMMRLTFWAEHTATRCNALQHTATQCNTHASSPMTMSAIFLVQCTATHYNTRTSSLATMSPAFWAHHTATRCNTATHKPRRQWWHARYSKRNALQRTTTHTPRRQQWCASHSERNTLQHAATHCNTPTSSPTMTSPTFLARLIRSTASVCVCVMSACMYVCLYACMYVSMCTWSKRKRAQYS